MKDRKKILKEELNRISNIIIDKYSPKKIILFGSLAHGKVHRWSDIDLVVIKDTRERFLDRIGDVLSMTYPRVGTNVIVYTPKEVEDFIRDENYFFIDEILGKGKVIYEEGQ